MKFADLHLHTIFSDGTYTPQEVVLEASKQGLSCIAVCDHDTVEGIEPTIEIGKSAGIEVLAGIELTAECDGLEVHLLGYFVDYKRKELIERLKAVKKIRVERIYKITDKLKDMGINLDPETILDISGVGTIGRLHIARAMVKDGIVKSVAEAFQRYIGDTAPAYIAGFRFSPMEAIKLIRESSGIPVLAHPYVLRKEALIPEFVSYGLMGLEVYYPEHTQSMVNFYLELSKKYGLLVTGGSDFHGSAKPEIKVGSVKIPYELVERLKETKRNFKG